MRTIISIILISLFSVFLSCKVKKDYQLQEIRTSYINKVDSSYIDSISGQITTFRAYTINFDSTGKPTSARIDETVKEAYTGLKSGQVNKVEKKTESVKIEAKKTDRTVGKIDVSIILIVVLVVIGIGIIYSKK